MDFEAVERVQLGHSNKMNGWHQMLETGVRGKSYITNATELLPRITLSVNVSLPIWRSRRTDIPSCPCWQIWLQDCDDLFRWHRYFCNVTPVSIQLIPMIWTRIRTFPSNWGGLPGSMVPYTTYCFVRKGGFDCQQLPPHMDCLVNTYKELIVRTPYGCDLLNRHKKLQVLFVKDENWKGT